MKVTVCFGNVRVVVPCGDGEILVRDLVREAILRYKKATGKGSDSWVSVHNLQSQGGGILDPDDKLSDVVDDKEQILANFEDGDGIHHHGGGDGASGSSVGTGSPDIFHDGEYKYGPNYPRTDIEVTGQQIASGITGSLQVRRGSEPALNQLPVGPPSPPEHVKRWSAAPLILEPPPAGSSNPDWTEDFRDDDETGGFKAISRDGSNRLSMQFLGDGGSYRWAEAASRAAHAKAHTSTSLPRESKRKEPLGQANVSTSPLPSHSDQFAGAELIIIRNEPGPLGIHVVPDYDRLGKDRGLLVQGIEPAGRIDRDGRLAMSDRIIEINGHSLLNLPFQRVQEMFKLSLTSPELRLRVVKNNGLDNMRKPPPPVYPKFPEDKENVSMVECEQKQSTNTKVATVSPTKKMPSVSKNLKSSLATNTRKIGRKIEIELTKGPHGLGFSITTRDNPAGGNCPIYIKKIIPKGAAVEDGRLKIGDRLLEVNDMEMTGKTQAEAVTVLRNAPLGSKVRIVVSRQEDVVDSALPRIIDADQNSEKEMELREAASSNDLPPSIPPLPQSHLQALRNRAAEKNNNSVAKIISQFQEAASITSPPEKVEDGMVFPWKHKEILTFNIPVHDSEKAGLGISVKGKTSGSQDLGIFIKSVINGGAASRDKRLRTNDQLLNVNGVSLLHQSNSDAMETLRKAMLHTEGPVPGNITLTIARRALSPCNDRSFSSRDSENNCLNKSSSGELYLSNESDPSHSTNSGHSGSSTNTVIFNPQLPNGIDSHQQVQTINVNPIHTWNPVLDRLTGNNKQQLRNESYYKATHDTWTHSMLANSGIYGNSTSTTLNMTSAEPILIEDDYGSRVLTHQNSKINVHMMNKANFSNGTIHEDRSDHEPDGKASLSAASTDNKSTDSNAQSTTAQGTDATYASQLSLENPQGFSRDALGRQSMSEKRHATLDAKSTDTYQRTKKLREERKTKDGTSNLVRIGSVESVISVNRPSDHPEYADKLGQLGPSLGMKKSSSLESLQTMVQEIQMQEEYDPAYSYRGPSGAVKVIRGRGCEESFRAAVDKHIADPNHRNEMGAKKHWLLDEPLANEREIDGFTNARGAPRQSSLNAALDGKHKPGKKKPGILKGIGSMFRFGKHRKMELANLDPQHYHINEFDEVPQQQQQQQLNQQQQQQLQQQQQKQQQHHPQQQPQQPQSQQQDHSQKHSQVRPEEKQDANLDRIKDQQKAHYHHTIQQNLMQQHKEQHIHREPQFHHGFTSRHAEQVQVIPENSVAPPIKYRNQFSSDASSRKGERKMHDQRLRHTYYQSDERNIYEQRQQGNIYNEYGGRPGSRSGITESVPFTHYVNYNELQNHLSRKDPLSDSQIVQMRLQVQQQRLKVEEESRKQHQYHSQRQTRTDSQLRPVSNFYEYESIQSMLNSRMGRPNLQAPHVPVPSQPATFQDPNSNSLPRQNSQSSVQSRHSSSRSQHPPHRGPFITQVTIGDHNQHKQNGTKV